MNGTTSFESDYKGMTTSNLLQKAAQRYGDMPAHSWKEGNVWKTINWRELRERIAELAEGLATLGVSRGDFVAIMIANRSEHVIADQAIVHAGATPSTFYATLSPDQIEYVANNAEAKVAILENADFMDRWVQIRENLPHLEHIVLMEDLDKYSDLDYVVSWKEIVDRGKKSLAKGRDAFEKRWKEVKPEDAATLIYTSGTTGPPKGVILTHENCVFEATMLEKLTGVDNGFTSISYLPFAHIAERILSLYIPLRKVSHVYFCPDVKQAMDYVRVARPFLFFGVPRVWEKVRAGVTAKLNAAENPRKRKLGLAAVESGIELVKLQQKGARIPLTLRLKHAVLSRLVLAKIREAIGLNRCEFSVSAAAPLPVDVAEFFAGLGLPLIEFYGMTETTGVSTGSSKAGLRIGWVGQAGPGVEVKLAEDGEILSRGPNSTPGYLNRPEATAELIDEDGWLHTGDIGEMSADGYVKVVDRKKELIITAGGKNISPANIEAMVKEHPLVGQVLAYGDRKPFVGALIVLDGDVAPGWAEQHDIEFKGIAELAKNPTVLDEVQKAVDSANSRLANVEQVKKFRILPTEWTAESEELTPTMKLKRRVIHKKYADDIEAIYKK